MLKNKLAIHVQCPETTFQETIFDITLVQTFQTWPDQSTLGYYSSVQDCTGFLETKKHLGLLISSSSTSDFELKVQRVFWTTASVWLFPKHCLGLSRLRLKVDSENSCWAVGQNQKRDLCHSLHFVGFYTSNMFRFRLPHNWRLWDRGDLWSKRGWFNTSCTNDSLTIHLLLGSRGC